MAKGTTTALEAAPVEERIRRIEAEPLLPNVPSVLDSAAHDAPDTPALNFFEDGVVYTYRELQQRVLDTARGMAALGIGRGTRMAVMLPNGPDFPVVWLALARLGAVIIPVNIGYTSHELEFVLTNAGAEWTCVHSDQLPTVRGLSEKLLSTMGGRIILAGSAEPDTISLGDLPRRDGQLPALSEIEPDRLLNIQYTSGTTGMPKGCMLTHRYWVISGKVNAFRDGRTYQRILASVPFFYMDPQWLMLMAFYHRGTLFVARKQSSSRFMGWIRDFRINFALFPEIVYKLPGSPDDRDNDIVRVNVYGLSPEIHADLENRFDFVAREAYGMTEIGSGMFMPIEATGMIGSGSCGRPSPFREARIVDRDGNLLGDGREGELQIRGPGIMLGYYNNPEATAAAFDGDWFRTGDIVRRDSEGYYYLVGRLKDMIRRAGENISANEVEAVLRAMPEIFEAAVVPEKDPIRGEEVKAYVALQDGHSRDTVPPDAILAHCRRHLARFKVPRYLAYRRPFAKTPSGKIAKHILAAEEKEAPSKVYDATIGEWLPDRPARECRSEPSPSSSGQA